MLAFRRMPLFLLLLPACWFITSAPLPASPPPCSTFTTDEIDIAYKAWRSSTTHLAEEQKSSCVDDPSMPATWFESDAIESSDSRFVVFVQRTVAGCFLKISGETMDCVTVRSEVVDHDVNGQACRAEILESQPVADTLREVS